MTTVTASTFRSSLTLVTLLVVFIAQRAAFPTVVFRDVRMTRAGGGEVIGGSPRNLWAALSLSTINDMLSKPLTADEVRFNQVKVSERKQLIRKCQGLGVAIRGTETLLCGEVSPTIFFLKINY